MKEGERRKRRNLARRGAAPARAERMLESAVPTPVGERIPDWIAESVRRTEAKASPGSLPVSVIKDRDRPAKDALVVVRLGEFARYFEGRQAGGGS